MDGIVQDVVYFPMMIFIVGHGHQEVLIRTIFLILNYHHNADSGSAGANYVNCNVEVSEWWNSTNPYLRYRGIYDVTIRLDDVNGHYTSSQL